MARPGKHLSKTTRHLRHSTPPWPTSASHHPARSGGWAKTQDGWSRGRAPGARGRSEQNAREEGGARWQRNKRCPRASSFGQLLERVETGSFVGTGLIHARKALWTNVWVKGRASWRKQDQVGEWGGGLWTQAGLRPEHSLAGLVWKVVASALSHLSPEI